MSVNSIYRWQGGALAALDYCDPHETSLTVADSWRVSDGLTLALGLHRDRFMSAIPAPVRGELDADAFWDNAIALIPRDGDWFPRVELEEGRGAPSLVFRLRSAPDTTRSVVVATHQGDDPRHTPLVKGPDLARLLQARVAVQAAGADEAILLTEEGYIVEGAYSGLLWWRGNILCGPLSTFDRVDSVTVRSVLALATALGIETYEEAVTPTEIDGVELWSLNALHGIRIVTRWVDGPALAELPSRLGTWRARLQALRAEI
ncbi:aminotransferase class IV [Glaciihabitans sp. dw_435]|uniref:aminotransferase class IV n=1 Tax=Glaciihabitans sp. dw_435 TaxID=2720081 RepID=UPI001BD44219|nr:aminotransferase class IV [Glaciihabitans sp. dw_435]